MMGAFVQDTTNCLDRPFSVRSIRKTAAAGEEGKPAVPNDDDEELPRRGESLYGKYYQLPELVVNAQVSINWHIASRGPN